MRDENWDVDKIYFTSDLHFFHANILKWASDTRRGIDIHAMNENIVEEWNKKVTHDGLVYLLGDISWRGVRETNEILNRLNGTIRLVKGNHDDSNLRSGGIGKRFEWVKDYHEVKIEGQKLIMMHYPISAWRDKDHGSLHLYGHTHGQQSHASSQDDNSLDVGIDNRANGDMQVWSWEEVKSYMRIQKGSNGNQF